MTLVNPVPIGVVTGPFSATLLRRIESMSSTGSACPVRSNESTPAWCRSHSIETPARGEDPQHRFGDFGTDAVAGDERDLVVMDIADCGLRIADLPNLFTDVPEQQHEPEGDVDRHRDERRACDQPFRIDGDREHQRDQADPGEEVVRRRTDELEDEQADEDDRAAGVADEVKALEVLGGRGDDQTRA